jgi:hypothetical protein
VARSAGGDAFGNDSSVWDRFAAAEERIDSEAIATEVDAAMRGEAMEDKAFDAKLAAAAGPAGLLGASGIPEADEALAKLKAKMAEQKAAKQKQLAASGEVAVGKDAAAPGGTGNGTASAPTGSQADAAGGKAGK